MAKKNSTPDAPAAVGTTIDTGGRKATQDEEAIAKDGAAETGPDVARHSLISGEALRAKGLCPLVMTRSRDAGVHIGYLARVHLGDVELIESRRLWSWTGQRHTLNEVALYGVVNARISEPIAQIALFDVCEIIPVTHEASKSLLSSRWQD